MKQQRNDGHFWSMVGMIEGVMSHLVVSDLSYEEFQQAYEIAARNVMVRFLPVRPTHAKALLSSNGQHAKKGRGRRRGRGRRGRR